MSFRWVILVAAALLVAPAVLQLAPSVDAARATIPVFTTYVGPQEPNSFGVLLGTGGEPSVGIDWRTDSVFYIHGFRTFRVSFGDGAASTWEDVTPPNTLFNIDPMLFADSPTGRVFTGGLDGHCSIMAYSDDQGETWTPTGNMCVPTLDHQSIAAGPWKEPRPAQAIYDRATYYCAQHGPVTCITSYDGGLTWGPPVPVNCGTSSPGLHGSVHVAGNGNVYVPFRDCGGGAGFAVSQNNGLGWTWKRVAGAVSPGRGFDPDVATTASGWVYIGYANGTGRSMAALTKDNGTTWSTVKDIGASVGVVNSTFHEAVAGDDERAMVAFLGTTTPGDAWSEDFAGEWHLYVATTYDAGAHWTTVKVTTDPVQRGWICDQGTGCPSDGVGGAQSHRNLLDFMDAQVDAFGRIVVAYADGCFGACALPSGTPAMSAFDAGATLSRQTGGPTLFSRFDPTTGDLFATAHGPYVVETGGSVTLTSAVTDGAAPFAYAWEVVTRPRGSEVDAAAFGSPSAASTSFTPDVAGEYRLRFEARDAAGEVATDVVTVTATGALGAPLPTCGVLLATDPAGDSTSTSGPGRRDVVALAASDDASTVTLCATLANAANAPSSSTRYTFFWDAPYEGPAVSYSATATISTAGAAQNAGFSKGAAGTTFTQLGGPATASVVGDTLRLTLLRSDIGAPADGDVLADLFVRVDSTGTPATTYDTAPNAGGADHELGQRIADTTAPTAVSGLAVADPATGSTLHLTWSAATDDVQVRDYVVRRANAPGGPYRTAGVVTGTSFTDAGLEQGATYHYRVAARDAAGNVGPASAEVAGTPTGAPVDATPPTAPGALAASGVTPYSLTLTWSASLDAESPVTGYRVERDGVLIATTAALTLSENALVPGTTYAYAVRAVNAEGLVSGAATLVVTTAEVAPDCGQVATALATDPALDATRGDGRAELLRVSVRETSSRIYFHVGVRNLTAPAPDTLFRVTWRVNDALGYAAYGRMTDAGTQVVGLYLESYLTGQEFKVGANPTVGKACDTIVIGVQKGDVDDLEDGALQGIEVRSTVNTTGAPEGQVHDVAVASDYVLDTALA